jgi:hypothetical protein
MAGQAIKLFDYVNMYIPLPLQGFNNLSVLIFNNSGIFLLLQHYEKSFIAGYTVDKLYVS